ncbi:hypothetical protein N0V95_001274 [Ascochyta clinopodiicola]|nr:hypothetical protein N0V95_001274 [Ascochyta clinopodiicola]
MALRHLSLNQRFITTLHSTYVDGPLPRNSPWPSDLFYFVRHLDLYIDGHASQLGDFLHGLASTQSPIESLSLTVYLHCDDSEDVHQYLWAATEELDVEGHAAMPKLRELTLSGFNLSIPVLQALQKIVKFERLTKLQVSGCHQASTFFAGLGTIASIEKFNLRHIAVDPLNEHSVYGNEYDEEDVPIDGCLEQVLLRSEKLESLCVGWHEHYQDERVENLLQTTLQKIYRDGKSLRILSVHPHNEHDYEEVVNSLGKNLESVCEACPNLEQLGYQLAWGVLDGDIGEPSEGLDEFVDGIARLRSLRMLHLRYPHETGAGQWDPCMSAMEEQQGYMRELSQTMQYIASEIFLKLEKIEEQTGSRHQLDTLVIGHLTPLRQTTGDCSLPQHCFIKAAPAVAGAGREILSPWVSPTDPATCVSRAEPVSRAMLRQLRSYTEILDLDPGVEPFEQWAGRAL